MGINQADFDRGYANYEANLLNRYLDSCDEPSEEDEWDESFGDLMGPPERLECKHYEGPDCPDC